MTTNAIIISALLVVAMSCTKKETVTETPETTTTTITTENTSIQPNENKDKDGSIIHNPETSETDTKNNEQNGENIKVEEYTNEGRMIKLTFRYDGEGNEVVVLSENDKKDMWLYRDRQTNIYAMDGVKLTVNGNKIELNEDGKTTVFNLR